MNIVNGFDIDTTEGAKAYLRSEGINVEQCVKDGMHFIERTKALILSNVVEQSEQLVCPNCNGKNIESDNSDIPYWCKDCGAEWAN